MKKRYFLILFILIVFDYTVYSQVSFGKNTADPSAVVDLGLTNKGLLIPRVNITNLASAITPIPTPINGLIVYNTNTTTGRGFYYYSTPGLNRWVRIFEIADAWNLAGNQNTIPGTNFIGTIDDRDIVFKRKNIISGRLTALSQNSSFGVGSLASLTNGSNLIAIGYESLFSNKGGYGSIAIGSLALRSNVDGTDNVAFGYQSLYNTTNNELNIAIGSSALFSNTTGSQNTAIGKNSLYKNLTGGADNKANIAIGNYTLQNNIINDYNIAVGHEALNLNTVDFNIAIGVKSLSAPVTGQNNISIGNYALQNNTSGGVNIAIGTYGLYSNILGLYNTAIGYKSLYSAIGGYNIAIGNSSGLNLSGGPYNIALGANTNFASGGAAYQLNIGNSIFGINLSALFNNPNPPSGNGSGASIGIGRNDPKATLHIEGSLAANIKTNSTVSDNDFTILVSSNLTLPAANATNNGRMYYLINNTAANPLINGNFRTNGSTTSSYTLGTTSGNKGILIQSYGMGGEWIILAKY